MAAGRAALVKASHQLMKRQRRKDIFGFVPAAAAAAAGTLCKAAHWVSSAALTECLAQGAAAAAGAVSQNTQCVLLMTVLLERVLGGWCLLSASTV